MAAAAHTFEMNVAQWTNPPAGMRLAGWGRARGGRFFNIVKTPNGDTLSLSTAPQTNLKELSLKLNRILIGQEKIIVVNTPANAFNQQAVDDVVLDMQMISDKVTNLRLSYPSWQRIPMTLLGLLPDPIKDGRISFEDKQSRVILNGQINPSNFTFFQQTNFPIWNSLMELLPEGRSYTIKNGHKFLSLRTRYYCLRGSGKSLKDTFKIFITCVGISISCMQILNGSYAFKATAELLGGALIHLIVSVLVAIKYLFAAIFHPGIIYKKL